MRYLVAIDGSDESKAALTLAAAHADAMDAHLDVVHSVIPEIQSVDGEQIIESAEEATERGQAVLETADEVLGSAIEFDTDLVYGHPVDEIPAYAEANDVDHIFVGHRGLSERQEELAGSVAKQVVDRADVPVTVVR